MKNTAALLEHINSNEKLKEQLDIFSDVIFLSEPDTGFEDDFDDVQVEWSQSVCAPLRRTAQADASIFLPMKPWALNPPRGRRDALPAV